MNSVERHRVALSRQQPDRVPVAPSLLVRPIRRAGARIFLHVCGDSRGIVTLKGNVDTGSFVDKSKTDFLEECRQVVEAGKPGGGFYAKFRPSSSMAR